MKLRAYGVVHWIGMPSSVALRDFKEMAPIAGDHARKQSSPTAPGKLDLATAIVNFIPQIKLIVGLEIADYTLRGIGTEHLRHAAL